MDDEYLAQLTAEKAIRRYRKRRCAVREWVKLRERNEALDLEVYALAALYILGPALIRALPERAAKFARLAETDAQVSDVPESRRPQRLAIRDRRSGWVNSWRQ